jgi:hypothetical protein
VLVSEDEESEDKNSDGIIINPEDKNNLDENGKEFDV